MNKKLIFLVSLTLFAIVLTSVEGRCKFEKSILMLKGKSGMYLGGFERTTLAKCLNWAENWEESCEGKFVCASFPKYVTFNKGFCRYWDNYGTYEPAPDLKIDRSKYDKVYYAVGCASWRTKPKDFSKQKIIKVSGKFVIKGFVRMNSIRPGPFKTCDKVMRAKWKKVQVKMARWLKNTETQPNALLVKPGKYENYRCYLSWTQPTGVKVKKAEFPNKKYVNMYESWLKGMPRSDKIKAEIIKKKAKKVKPVKPKKKKKKAKKAKKSRAPKCKQVTFFSECDYDGSSQVITKSVKKVKQPKSICVPKGQSVTIYEKPNYQGKKQKITKSVDCVKNLNFQVFVKDKLKGNNNEANMLSAEVGMAV